MFWIIPSNKTPPVSSSCWKEPSSSSSNQGRSYTQDMDVQNKLISCQCVNPRAIPVTGMSFHGDTEVQGALGEVREGRLLLFSCISRGSVLSARLLLGLLGAFSTVLVTNRAGSSPADRRGAGGGCHLCPCVLPCSALPSGAAQLCQPVLTHEVQLEGQLGPSTAQGRQFHLSIFHFTQSWGPWSCQALGKCSRGGHPNGWGGSGTAHSHGVHFSARGC